MMKKISICVLLTCFNRKEKTLRALESLDDERFWIDYLIIDDASSDGTRQALREWNKSTHRKSDGRMRVIKGSGSLFWAGGMRRGMEILLKIARLSQFKSKNKGYEPAFSYDYLLLINDDVAFFPGVLTKLIERSKEKGGLPVTGATKSADGSVSYGGVLYDMKRAKPRHMDISEADSKPCDTMNCNCFLLPWRIFIEVGKFDPHYRHSSADYDYGFKLKRLGYEVWLSDFYVGSCDDNPIAGTWRDTSLGRLERLRKKESIKGLPRKEWFYYLSKNFGLPQAIWHSLTPYLRIILGK